MRIPVMEDETKVARAPARALGEQGHAVTVSLSGRGRIEVRSTRTEGTSFEVILPRTAGDPEGGRG